MKSLDIKIILIAVLPLYLAACGAGDSDQVSVLFCDERFGNVVSFGEDDTVVTDATVNSAATLSAAISVNGPSRRYAGGIPAAAASATGPTLTLVNPVVPIYDRSFVDLTFTVESAGNSRLKAVFLQITGIAEAILVPIDAASVVGAGQYRVTLIGPLTTTGSALIPTVTDGLQNLTLEYSGFFVPDSEFSPDLGVDDFEGYDQPSQWSAVGAAAIEVTALGVGIVQIGLSWNTGPETGDGNVDLDLWLDEPDGNIIKWNNRASVAAPLTMGVTAPDNLDTDNVLGYGPENIYFDVDPPAGQYLARVNYYAGSQVSDWVAVVSDCGTTEVYRGTLSVEGADDGQKGIIANWTHGAGCSLPASTPTSAPRPSATLFEASACRALYGDKLTF